MLCALVPGLGEVDVILADDLPVSPQVRSALPGVIEVEEV